MEDKNIFNHEKTIKILKEINNNLEDISIEKISNFLIEYTKLFTQLSNFLSTAFYDVYTKASILKSLSQRYKINGLFL